MTAFTGMLIMIIMWASPFLIILAITLFLRFLSIGFFDFIATYADTLKKRHMIEHGIKPNSIEARKLDAMDNVGANVETWMNMLEQRHKELNDGGSLKRYMPKA